MKKFLISFIEDNHLGVYPKEILIERENIVVAFKESFQLYPTLYGIKEIFGELDERWINFYTNEAQDQIRRGQLEMKKNLHKMFEGETES